MRVVAHDVVVACHSELLGGLWQATLYRRMTIELLSALRQRLLLSRHHRRRRPRHKWNQLEWGLRGQLHARGHADQRCEDCVKDGGRPQSRATRGW